MSSSTKDNKQSKQKIQLTYFGDNKGRNELSRLIFVVGGIEFENEEIDHKTYVKLRDANKLPFGQVPTLTIDGRVHGQSCAIARYAAKISRMYPNDNIQALKTDAIVDSWRDVLDSFYDCAFAREVIDGKLSMFPRPASERWSKLNTFIATVLNEHVIQWNQMLVNNNNAGQFIMDIFPCWADLAVYDVMKTMSGVIPESEYDRLASNCPDIMSLVDRIDSVEAIKTHLEKHPYKDIKLMFSKPSLLQRAAEAFLFPALKLFILPAKRFVEGNFARVTQKLLLQNTSE